MWHMRVRQLAFFSVFRLFVAHVPDEYIVPVMPQTHYVTLVFGFNLLQYSAELNMRVK